MNQKTSMMSQETQSTVFDYRLLRLVIGVIALSLPLVVWLAAGTKLNSISASYYTDARNYFVGMLFVVSAFLLAYNGHFLREALASKIASLAAAGIALFPTLCDEVITTNICLACSTLNTAIVHYVCAFTMFGILAYFCLDPFSDKTKTRGVMYDRRRWVYQVCGWGIIVSFALGGVTMMMFKYLDISSDNRILFWVESLALICFGIAWIVSGKTFASLADKNEKYNLFKQ